MSHHAEKKWLGLILVAIALGTVTTVRAEPVSFTKVVLDKTFRSEGVAVGDVNRDGKLDILAGEVWYEAPDWKMHELLPPGKYDGKTGYSKTFANFACDVNRDGWIDSVITTMMGEPSLWYENPQNKPGHWKVHTGTRSACNETPLFADLLGNGKPVALWGVQPEGYIAWFSLPEDPSKLWDMHIIGRPEGPGQRAVQSRPGRGRPQRRRPQRCPRHRRAGGRPRRTARRSTGSFTRWISGRTARIWSSTTSTAMGDNDVITSSAHDYGIWWFEQLPGGKVEKSHAGICKTFSQTHAIRLADINRDGIMDFVTGKRYFAHNGKDPGRLRAGPAGLVRDSAAREGQGPIHPAHDRRGFRHRDPVRGRGHRTATAGWTSSRPTRRACTCSCSRARRRRVSLFDGKTFDGWEGNLDFFRVEDGAIVAGSLNKAAPRNEFLCTKKAYGDFELRLKVKLLGDPQVRQRRAFRFAAGASRTTTR